MAHAIVTKFGMSDKIGLVGFKEEEYTRRHSESTQRVRYFCLYIVKIVLIFILNPSKEIDQEIKRVIDEQTVVTREKIKEYRALIEK